MEKCIVVIVCFIVCFRSFSLAADWKYPASKQYFLQFELGTPIKSFLENDVCGSYEGKKRLYTTMKANMCGINRLYVAQMVMALCREQSQFLHILISALYDVDKDGMISFHEKRQFEKFGRDIYPPLHPVGP